MQSPRAAAPDVTYVMAAYNAAPWIEAAIASALGQRGVHIEVVVVDDASQDGTAGIAQAMAMRDPRVVPIALAGNGGPSAARNMALDRARGAWIGILDADDLIEPDRTKRLLALAHETGCAVVADDVLRFSDAEPWITSPLLGGSGLQPPDQVGPAEYLARNRLTGGEANLGYLKPVFARDFLVRHGLRYDERLRIGEDFDLCLRCLLAGTDLAILPEALYRYRVVGASLSRSLKSGDLAAMREVHADLRLPETATPEVRSALADHGASVDELLAYVGLREALRERRWGDASRHFAGPRAWRCAARIAATKLRRRLDRRAHPRSSGRVEKADRRPGAGA